MNESYISFQDAIFEQIRVKGQRQQQAQWLEEYALIHPKFEEAELKAAIALCRLGYCRTCWERLNSFKRELLEVFINKLQRHPLEAKIWTAKLFIGYAEYIATIKNQPSPIILRHASLTGYRSHNR